MTRLLLLTPAELTRDPRARRAAASALALGLDVAGACIVRPGEEPAPLPGIPVERAGVRGRSRSAGPAGNGGTRAGVPFARELRGLYRLGRLAVRTGLLVLAGKRAGTADIVHANDLDTLPAAAILARGHRLVYDAHELYSAQETDPPRLYAAVLLAIERRLARRADVVVTTCDAFAREIETRLGLPRSPLIVLNAPELWPESRQPGADGALQVVYYAAGDHPGRPLDDLIDAAAFVPEATWAIRLVNVDTARRTQQIAERGLEKRVVLSPPLSPDRLQEALVGNHVGVILQRPITPNDALALPNKLFEYMMAGLAVVAPDLPALAPIVNGEGVGLLFTPGDARSLAEAVQTLARDRARLDAMRARAREVATTRYNAEAQRAVLRDAWGLRA